ncbi:hypothetical protein PC112_g23090 [Phytophthora cactorum]|nr:hypothetical protein PC112_g23090 [Phytophthora cactorum]
MFGSDSDSQSDAEEHDGDGASVEGGASVNGGGSVVDDDRVAVPANDVNGMTDGELSDEYEAVDSSGSDSSANSGDDVIERRECPDDTLESDEDVAQMDDAFM